MSEGLIKLLHRHLNEIVQYLSLLVIFYHNHQFTAVGCYGLLLS